MRKQINFDMDGTLVDFYGVEGWLDDLMNRNTRPYREAKPRITEREAMSTPPTTAASQLPA